MKTHKLIFLFALCSTIAGCASIAGDNTRAVMVKSNPPGADVYVDNERYGVTPTLINLPNYIYGGKSITLRKPGYRDQTKVIQAQFQPVSLFNVLFWPGFIIDAATGNIVKINPENLNMTFKL